MSADRPQPGDVARRVRDWFADAIRTAVAEPQASLGIGYLLGQRTALPDTLEDQFRMLGLVHLVVASGSNLIIIARLLRKYLARISKFTATAATFIFIGWYLSFAAFGGVILLAPLINRYLWGEKEPGFMRYIFVATLSAQIATLPIIALTFGEYSPLAIASNLLVQPLVPIAMGLTFLAGLAGALVSGIAAIIGWPAEFVLSYILALQIG